MTKGCKDVPHVKKDPDIDPLRPPDDFQKLVAELKGRGQQAVSALPVRTALPGRHSNVTVHSPIPAYND